MDLDLTDPGLLLRDDVLADPKPFYDLLRREAPVYRIPDQDTFLVSDPLLIREAVRRPEDFSSNLVSLLYDDGSGCPVSYPMAPYRHSIHVLSTADPPLHTEHRALLQPHLSPAAVASLEPAVSAIVGGYLADALAAGALDIVPAFTDAVPARTICEVIGLPASDVPAVIGFAYGTGMLLDGVTDREGISRGATSAMELGVFVRHRLDEALALPPSERAGLLGIFSAQIEAGEVTEGDVCNMLVVLVTAGSETTASLLATAVDTLAKDPELQDRLRRDPAGIPEAVEDMLRENGPFQFHYRYVPADTELGGVPIPAESCVLLMWAAANRPSPEALADDAAAVAPSGAPHFAFGRGLHFCIGAPVARLEARIALEQLLARTRSITLDPDRAMTRRPSIFIRRHATLPVVLEPA